MPKSSILAFTFVFCFLFLTSWHCVNSQQQKLTVADNLISVIVPAFSLPTATLNITTVLPENYQLSREISPECRLVNYYPLNNPQETPYPLLPPRALSFHTFEKSFYLSYDQIEQFTWLYTFDTIPLQCTSNLTCIATIECALPWPPSAPVWASILQLSSNGAPTFRTAPRYFAADGPKSEYTIFDVDLLSYPTYYQLYTFSFSGSASIDQVTVNYFDFDNTLLDTAIIPITNLLWAFDRPAPANTYFIRCSVLKTTASTNLRNLFPNMNPATPNYRPPTQERSSTFALTKIQIIPQNDNLFEVSHFLTQFGSSEPESSQSNPKLDLQTEYEITFTLNFASSNPLGETITPFAHHPLFTAGFLIPSCQLSQQTLYQFVTISPNDSAWTGPLITLRPYVPSVSSATALVTLTCRLVPLQYAQYQPNPFIAAPHHPYPFSAVHLLYASYMQPWGVQNPATRQPIEAIPKILIGSPSSISNPEIFIQTLSYGYIDENIEVNGTTEIAQNLSFQIDVNVPGAIYSSLPVNLIYDSSLDIEIELIYSLARSYSQTSISNEQIITPNLFLSAVPHTVQFHESKRSSDDTTPLSPDHPNYHIISSPVVETDEFDSPTGNKISTMELFGTAFLTFVSKVQSGQTLYYPVKYSSTFINPSFSMIVKIKKPISAGNDDIHSFPFKLGLDFLSPSLVKWGSWSQNIEVTPNKLNIEWVIQHGAYSADFTVTPHLQALFSVKNAIQDGQTENYPEDIIIYPFSTFFIDIEASEMADVSQVELILDENLDPQFWILSLIDESDISKYKLEYKDIQKINISAGDSLNIITIKYPNFSELPPNNSITISSRVKTRLGQPTFLNSKSFIPAPGSNTILKINNSDPLQLTYTIDHSGYTPYKSMYILGSNVDISFSPSESFEDFSTFLFTLLTFPLLSNTPTPVYSSTPVMLATLASITAQTSLPVNIPLPSTIIAQSKVVIQITTFDTNENIVSTLYSPLFSTLSTCHVAPEEISFIGNYEKYTYKCPTNAICTFSGCQCNDGFKWEDELTKAVCVSLPKIQSQCGLCNKSNTLKCEETNSVPLCTCNNGFMGVYCDELSICDGRSSQDCSDNGFLVPNTPQVNMKKCPSFKQSSCKCYGGWSGEHCEICDRKCQNDGEVFADCDTCGCPSGFMGKDCQCQSYTVSVIVNGYNDLIETTKVSLVIFGNDNEKNVFGPKTNSINFEQKQIITQKNIRLSLPSSATETDYTLLYFIKSLYTEILTNLRAAFEDDELDFDLHIETIEQNGSGTPKSTQFSFLFTFGCTERNAKLTSVGPIESIFGQFSQNAIQKTGMAKTLFQLQNPILVSVTPVIPVQASLPGPGEVPSYNSSLSSQSHSAAFFFFFLCLIAFCV